MLRVYTALVLLVSLLLTSGAVVRADDDEKEVKLPKLSYVGTMRHSHTLTFNGQVLQTCQAAWESWNRRYERCEQLASVPELDLAAGRIVETYIYDQSRYERYNGETLWRMTRNSRYDRNLSINQGNFTVTTDSVLSNMGEVNVEGIPTTHYQYWILNKAVNEENGGQAVYDLFIANRSAQTYVVRDQFSGRGNHDGLGEGDLTGTWFYYDINTPITITPPTPEEVSP